MKSGVRSTVNRKTKTVIFNMPKNFKMETKFPALQDAARKAMKEVNAHFKKDKWDLDYSHYVTDVFYRAFGHHLENYFFNELGKSGKYILRSGKGPLGGLVIALNEKKKRKPTRGKNKQK